MTVECAATVRREAPADRKASRSGPDRASRACEARVRPRVLAVTSEPPWPLDSGGRLRTFHLLQALAARTELRVVCPVQPHQEHALPALSVAGLSVRPVSVSRRTLVAEARRLAGAAVRREPYVLYRRHYWPAAVAAFRAERVEHRPDLLYFDHLDSWLYASDSGPDDTAGVIDLHNVYSRLVHRTAGEQTHVWKRHWLAREAGRLAHVERRLARSGLTVFAVSESDAAYFRDLGAPGVHAIPNGVDCRSRADLPTGRLGPPVVLFLGTMSWGPNITAAKFLARTVLPAILPRVSEARLLIVGANPPAGIRDLHGGPITVTGSVPDVKPFLAEASVMAVPLDAGGGTRLKILEAFAAGLPVVSTRIGAEGLAAQPGTHYLCAERPDFADAVAHLLTNPIAGERLAEAARMLVRGTYDWQIIGERAAACAIAAASRRDASEILDRPSSPRRVAEDARPS